MALLALVSMMPAIVRPLIYRALLGYRNQPGIRLGRPDKARALGVAGRRFVCKGLSHVTIGDEHQALCLSLVSSRRA